MLDFDLAALYGVETKRLNEQVKRNIERFPEDFMFQLTKGEWVILQSQITTAKKIRMKRSLPYAFTENGVAMLSSVLRSPLAELQDNRTQKRRRAIGFIQQDKKES